MRVTPSQHSPSAGSQIRGLFAVLFSAIATAFLIVWLLVNQYGPSGQYSIDQVLLRPNLLTQLTYQEQDPSTGKMSQYVYDHMEYNYFDSQLKAWQKRAVTPDRYKQFYEKVAGDRSIVEPTEETTAPFIQKRSAVLTIWVKNSLSASLKTFQEVAFVDEVGLFRVELRQQDNLQPWAYFKHPKIYEETRDLFISP